MAKKTLAKQIASAPKSAVKGVKKALRKVGIDASLPKLPKGLGGGKKRRKGSKPKVKRHKHLSAKCQTCSKAHARSMHRSHGKGSWARTHKKAAAKAKKRRASRKR